MILLINEINETEFTQLVGANNKHHYYLGRTDTGMLSAIAHIKDDYVYNFLDVLKIEQEQFAHRKNKKSSLVLKVLKWYKKNRKF